ncbi:MAG: hypothetical protein ACOYBW_10830 [Fluviibacter phosphoraccumulans]
MLLGKRSISRLLKVLLFFLIILDTGGWLGIRVYCVSAVFLLYGSRSINKLSPLLVICWLIGLLLITPAIYVSYTSGIEIDKILPWIVVPVFFPIFFVSVAGARLNDADIIAIGYMLSTCTLLVSLIRFLDLDFANVLVGFLIERDAGFFNIKESFFGVQPDAYFKWSLFLVIPACIAIFNKQKISSASNLLALLAAPSRFGAILVSMYLLFNSKINRSLAVLTILFCIFIAFGYFEQDEGVSIRTLHFNDYSNLLFDVNRLFWGYGPGSEFYSSGFQMYTDNTEISQLEILRKFGIYFFLFLNAVYFYVVVIAFKKNFRAHSGALLIYYLASISNPVLVSIPSLIYFCYVISLFKLDPHPRFLNFIN